MTGTGGAMLYVLINDLQESVLCHDLQHWQRGGDAVADELQRKCKYCSAYAGL